MTNCDKQAKLRTIEPKKWKLPKTKQNLATHTLENVSNDGTKSVLAR